MLNGILLPPLLGFLVNGIWALRATHHKNGLSSKSAGTIASLAIGLSFCFSVLSFFKVLNGETLESHWFDWIQVGSLDLGFHFVMDRLSAIFALVITGIGFLIHVYSIGYMEEDETPGKFFSYLNLFCFSMLILVLGSSLPLLFVGWEGVGVCSYLLIGYWFEDIEKAKAGKKAFVANRVGDLGFILGAFILFKLFGTLNLSEISNAVGGQEKDIWWTIAAGLLFLGCTGKSAQIPLYVWLPDAMAGPTPVSALIHAATMVTSGIYLMTRLNGFFIEVPEVLTVVAWVGGLTGLVSATIAIAQDDIKKVLAYSTVSQLGFMFMAAGVGSFDTAVFHVLTHAFFKALMFLGAGSVIHGMHHEQDMQKMGGLSKDMPITYKTFLIGWLAICGIVPFAGFFSKDEILWKSLSSPLGGFGLYLIGSITALLTATYMTRLMALTFWGKFRGHHHAHESPSGMLFALIVLAGLSLCGGWIGIPHFHILEGYLAPLIPKKLDPTIPTSLEWITMGISLVGASIAMAMTARFYRVGKPAELKKKFESLRKILENKWYVDEFYEAIIVRPIQRVSKILWKVFDQILIDGMVLFTAQASKLVGAIARTANSGALQVYVFLFVFALMGVFFYVVV